MYCTRCGAELSASDQVCPECVRDLRASGSVRLTPKLTEAEIRAEMPEELITTAVRPAITDEALTSPGHRRSPSHEGHAASAAPEAPALPDRDDPALHGPDLDGPALNDPELVDRAWDDEGERQRSERSQRHILAARSRQQRRRNQLAVLVVTVALLIAVVPITIVSWSFFNLSPREREAIPSPTVPATTPAPTSAPPSSAKPTPTQTPKPTISRLPWPSYAKACGKDVAVNRNTSCELAVAVAAKVDRTRTDRFNVTATNPRTGRTYTVACARTDFIVCTGGRIRIVLQPLPPR